MRVLLLNQYYHPDVAPTAQMAADLGAGLVRRGHEVLAVASARGYAGTERLPLGGEHAGVKIVRVPATAFGRGNKVARAIDYATFYLGAIGPVLAGARPDVVVALSTPPFISSIGLLAQRLRGARLVCWVMDVYPDLAVRLGALGANGAPARLLSAAARATLERADAVVALDEAMRDALIAGGARPDKVEVIDNWCDGDTIRPASGDNPLRRELGLEGKFTISYSGNMGHGHEFGTLVEAMAALRERPIHWLLIGDGPRRAELERAIKARGVARARFLPYRPREELAVSLTAADASLVTLDEGMAGLIVPSKIYSILAAGLPVVYVGPDAGRVAAVLREHPIGCSVRNGDAEGLARAVVSLEADAAARAEMGRRARALFDRCFDREVALERHHQLLLRVAGATC